MHGAADDQGRATDVPPPATKPGCAAAADRRTSRSATVRTRRTASSADVPELPDVAVYREALAARVVGQPLTRIRLANPFLLRTAVPPIAEAEGKHVRAVRRVGKRIVLALDGDLFLVLHLMIAGRLRWLDAGRQGSGAHHAGVVRVSERHARLYRSGNQASRVAAPGAGAKLRSLRIDAGGLEVLDRQTARPSPRASRRRITRSSAR